jgi:hypothetical protein
LPETLAADAADLISNLPPPGAAIPDHGRTQVIDLNGVVPPIRSARFGVAGRPDPDQAARIADALAVALGSSAGAGARVLVLATEEFMALPLAVAAR